MIQFELNPFAIIVSLFVGGMVWGAIGMTLTIPTVAMLKVILDTTGYLQPFGFSPGYPPDEKTLDYSRHRKTLKRKKTEKQPGKRPVRD